ncbi:hypothetical protein D9M70_539110 [compost metagenome]
MVPTPPLQAPLPSSTALRAMMVVDSYTGAELSPLVSAAGTAVRWVAFQFSRTEPGFSGAPGMVPLTTPAPSGARASTSSVTSPCS